MSQLLEVNEDDPLAVRDRAMMELMYGAGLRLAELVGVDVRDVQLRSGELRVIGKGDKERKVPFSGMATEWVGKWLRVRGDLAAPGEPALFVSSLERVFRIVACKSAWLNGGRNSLSQAILVRINCVTHLRHICSNQAITYVRCRSF